MKVFRFIRNLFYNSGVTGFILLSIFVIIAQVTLEHPNAKSQVIAYFLTAVLVLLIDCIIGLISYAVCDKIAHIKKNNLISYYRNKIAKIWRES